MKETKKLKKEQEIKCLRAFKSFILFCIKMNDFNPLWKNVNSYRIKNGFIDRYLSLAKYNFKFANLYEFKCALNDYRQLILEDSEVNINYILNRIKEVDEVKSNHLKKTWIEISSMNSLLIYMDEKYTLKELADLFLYGEYIGEAHFKKRSQSRVLNNKLSEMFTSKCLRSYDDDTLSRICVFLYNCLRLAVEIGDYLINYFETIKENKSSLRIIRDRKTNKVKDVFLRGDML